MNSTRGRIPWGLALGIVLPVLISGTTPSSDSAPAPTITAGLEVFDRTGRYDSQRDMRRAEAAAVLDAVRAQMNTTSDGLEFVEHPNGMCSVDLQGRFMSYSIATESADGSLETFCASSPEDLHAHATRSTGQVR